MLRGHDLRSVICYVKLSEHTVDRGNDEQGEEPALNSIAPNAAT
jgi:hypothetical protein